MSEHDAARAAAERIAVRWGVLELLGDEHLHDAERLIADAAEDQVVALRGDVERLRAALEAVREYIAIQERGGGMAAAHAFDRMAWAVESAAPERGRE